MSERWARHRNRCLFAGVVAGMIATAVTWATADTRSLVMAAYALVVPLLLTALVAFIEQTLIENLVIGALVALVFGGLDWRTNGGPLTLPEWAFTPLYVTAFFIPILAHRVDYEAVDAEAAET